MISYSYENTEEQAYEIVADEISAGNIQRGLWLKALVEAKSDENVAKTIYAKLRVKQILREARSLDQEAKRQERDSKRRKSELDKALKKADEMQQFLRKKRWW